MAGTSWQQANQPAAKGQQGWCCNQGGLRQGAQAAGGAPVMLPCSECCTMGASVLGGARPAESCHDNDDTTHQSTNQSIQCSSQAPPSVAVNHAAQCSI
jgi:hypothetical protein